MIFTQESQLIQKAKAGDRRAYGKLVKTYQDKILYLTFDMIGNYQDAKDAAQETFIKAYQNLSQFKEKARFSTWLYRIAVNTTKDMYRRKARHPHQSLEKSMAKESFVSNTSRFIANPDQMIESDERRHHIEQALEKLSINQKTAIVLKYFHQQTIQEISEMMECKEVTVRTHIFRALRHLKKHLKQYNQF